MKATHTKSKRSQLSKGSEYGNIEVQRGEISTPKPEEGRTHMGI